MSRASRKIWSDRVRRWKASGLTAKAYAARHAFAAGSLYRWSSRLRGEERAQGASLVPVIPPVVEIVRAAGVSFGAPVVDTEAAHEAFEVFLGDRVRIRVPVRFDAEALTRLVAALERC